ncbi:acyl-CoA dehydrogenase family protein [Siccirubricoccus deserti]
MDAPIFDPAAFRLTPQEAALTAQAREFGATVLAPRAARWDREASFPTGNYRDMHANGLLGICIPAEDGGLGAGFRAYCLTAAELGRYCGATALTWNMHVCSTLWTGALTEDLDMPEPARAEHRARCGAHYAAILRDGLVYSQPFSEGGAAAAGTIAFGTTARRVPGGYRINGKKILRVSPGTRIATASSAPKCGRARPSRRAATPSTSPSRATPLE